MAKRAEIDDLHRAINDMEMSQMAHRDLNATDIFPDDRVDYAVNVHYHTEVMTLSTIHRVESILQLWITRNYNQAAVRPTLRSGDCIPLRQDPDRESYVVVELRNYINVSGLTIELATSKLGGDPDSAPKIMIMALSRDGYHFEPVMDDGDRHQQFTYDPLADGGRKYFEVSPQSEEARGSRFAKLQIDENHGADYTCLYRVQVHGEIV